MKQRLFVAIKLNQTTFDALCLFQMDLKKELPFKGIRWVDPGLFHLTLHFLGDTETNQIPRLISNLESVGQQIKSFDLILDGVGHFGSKSSIRTIWAGSQPSSELRNLFNQVIESTEFLKVDQHPRFSPHVTLARGSDWLTAKESFRIVEVLSERKATVFGVTKITSFELIESTLNPSGPVYKTIKVFNLV